MKGGRVGGQQGGNASHRQPQQHLVTQITPQVAAMPALIPPLPVAVIRAKLPGPGMARTMMKAMTNAP